MSLMAGIEFELLMHIRLEMEMENAAGNQVYECFVWLLAMLSQWLLLVIFLLRLPMRVVLCFCN